MKPKITVFIHGTTPLKYLIFKPTIVKNFFDCPSGLVKAKDVGHQFHVKKIAKIISQSSPAKFSLKHFYLFGWSGKLSPSERKKEAQNLYKQLLVLFKECGKDAFIQIITGMEKCVYLY